MIYKALEQSLLIEPIKNGADSLFILSGYASPNMASWLIKNLREQNLLSAKISLIVGMTSYDGLSISSHSAFKEMHNSGAGFSCSYTADEPPIHSNLYISMKHNKPYTAFVSSADFTQRSFLSSQMEIAEQCNPEEAYKYYCEAENKSIYCTHNDVENTIILKQNHYIQDLENDITAKLSGSSIEIVTLSLLMSNGEIGSISGLNWGQREKRNLNQAYIPLPRKIAKSGFFPLNKQHFTVNTDDGKTLILRVEQQGDKAITTPLSNAQLGEYFRTRLGLSYGAFVKKSDLISYGRTDVDFYKIDDEEYYMDFSRKISL